MDIGVEGRPVSNYRPNPAKWCLAKAAEVNARDRGGGTPLDWAVKRDYKGVAKLLRQHGGHD